MIVVISAEAEFDIETIGDRIAINSPIRAMTFVRELRDQCLGLRELPQAFPLVPRYEEQGIRRRVYGNYLIFYKAQGETVTVLHVLHGAMDYEAVLFPD